MYNLAQVQTLLPPVLSSSAHHSLLLWLPQMFSIAVLTSSVKEEFLILNLISRDCTVSCYPKRTAFRGRESESVEGVYINLILFIPEAAAAAAATRSSFPELPGEAPPNELIIGAAAAAFAKLGALRFLARTLSLTPTSNW